MCVRVCFPVVLAACGITFASYCRDKQKKTDVGWRGTNSQKLFWTEDPLITVIILTHAVENDSVKTGSSKIGVNVCVCICVRPWVCMYESVRGGGLCLVNAGNTFKASVPGDLLSAARNTLLLFPALLKHTLCTLHYTRLFFFFFTLPLLSLTLSFTLLAFIPLPLRHPPISCPWG